MDHRTKRNDNCSPITLHEMSCGSYQNGTVNRNTQQRYWKIIDINDNDRFKCILGDEIREYLISPTITAVKLTEISEIQIWQFVTQLSGIDNVYMITESHQFTTAAKQCRTKSNIQDKTRKIEVEMFKYSKNYWRKIDRISESRFDNLSHIYLEKIMCIWLMKFINLRENSAKRYWKIEQFRDNETDKRKR